MNQTTFQDAREGDEVVRMLAGLVPMRLRVTKVHEGLIFCGPWTFDAATGAEIDAELEWGPEYGRTGSHLTELISNG